MQTRKITFIYLIRMQAISHFFYFRWHPLCAPRSFSLSPSLVLSRAPTIAQYVSILTRCLIICSFCPPQKKNNSHHSVVLSSVFHILLNTGVATIKLAQTPIMNLWKFGKSSFYWINCLHFVHTHHRCLWTHTRVTVTAVYQREYTLARPHHRPAR